MTFTSCHSTTRNMHCIDGTQNAVEAGVKNHVEAIYIEGSYCGPPVKIKPQQTWVATKNMRPNYFSL